MTSDQRSGPRPGRPRLMPGGEGQEPRDEILEAAAELFAERGFAGTSTRAIAERVGIRQASLYYHFSGKDEMLIELLTNSVRPSLDEVTSIEEAATGRLGPAAALYLLALVDVRTLMLTPHNVGSFYLLPDVQSPTFARFHDQRRELQHAYGRLGVRAATPEVAASVGRDRLGELLIQTAEIVIQLRRNGTVAPERDADVIAASCLRLCGLDGHTVEAAGVQARRYQAGAGASSSE
ncbi:TetR/AcrR family transcriptional regulator [Millisia brevis]|uniref:TetR/AcrR family transcriptional regulator n=1 Tax=Millisia brevis TaxID=264148 RepID=UPI00083486C5|nr:TetR/AcrR family transcriptional regulator [Millisia brevis]